jgi:basic amino acid/polyamine antiporter, APA family
VVLPKRQLSLWHIIAVATGMVIGAGIFKTASLAALNAGSSFALFAVWIAGGIISIMGALCYAELTSAYPHEGGDYHILREAYGDTIAFLFAWSRFSVIFTGSTALLAFVLGDYLNQVIPLGRYGIAVLAIIIIVFLTLLNLRGIKVGAGTQIGLTIIDVIGLLLVGVAGLWLLLHNAPPVQPILSIPPDMNGTVPNYGTAMVFVLLAFGGWNDVATLSAEARDDQRGMVRALIASLTLVTFLYVLANWAYWRGLGLGGLAASQAPAADLMRHAFGPVGEWIMVGLVSVAAIGIINALIIVGGRTAFATASNFATLSWMSNWNAARGTPTTAVWAQSIMSILLIIFGTLTRDGFTTMVDYLTPIYWLFIILSALAVIILRRKHPERARPFKVPFYPLLPLIFAEACLYVLWSSLVYVKIGAVVSISVFVIGSILIIILRALDKRKTT